MKNANEYSGLNFFHISTLFASPLLKSSFYQSLIYKSVYFKSSPVQSSLSSHHTMTSSLLFDKSDDSDIEIPFRFISLIDELTALRDVRSLMICHVLRNEPYVGIFDIIYYQPYNLENRLN